MRLPWIKLAGLLLVIWAVVGGVIYFARGSQPTPESIAKYIDTHSLEGRGPRERRKIIESVADQLNRLGYEDRRETRSQRRPDNFFKLLTPEEQGYFLDRTLPTGFTQMMEALNKMTPEKRKQFVNKALADMKKREGEERPEDGEKLDANAQRIIDQGFRSFYSDASAEVKMDVAPLIEQLQKNLQGAR